MEPITMALTAGSLVGNFIQGQAAKKQAQQQLALQKLMHDENMRFAKSGRTDAYGNKVSYNEALQEWLTTLTPQQLRILKAGEREQLVGLTEDAGRNRAARGRQDVIGKSSAEDYNTESARYRYGPQKSEQSIFDEISSLVSRARSAPNAERTRQQLRQGSPLIQSNNSGQERNDAATALATRKAALDEFITRNNARNSSSLPALGFFREGAGAGGGAPINFGTQSDQLSKTQNSMAELIAQVAGKGASEIGKAGESLVKATGQQFGNLNQTLAASLRGMPRAGANRAGVKPIASSTGFDNSELDLDKLLAGGIY